MDRYYLSFTKIVATPGHIEVHLTDDCPVLSEGWEFPAGTGGPTVDFIQRGERVAGFNYIAVFGDR